MYKLINSTTVQRLSDTAFIPFAEGNTDYQQYQQWLSEGNIPTPADLPVNPRIAEIKLLLSALDIKKIRPIAEADSTFLAILNAQTIALRQELATL